MHKSISVYKSYKDLLNDPPQDSPYLFDQIFNEDIRKKQRLCKSKFTILKKLDGHLQSMLLPDEKVFGVSIGVQSSFIEQFLFGWATVYLNRRVFVFSTKRIILVQVKGKYDPGQLVSQLPYLNIRRVKKDGFGNIKLFFTDNKSSQFTGMPKPDRILFSDLVALINKDGAEKAELGGSTENLCPHCYRPVPGFPGTCPLCGKKFKSPMIAGLLSLLFPGIGDMYLGHFGFAILEIIGASLVWLGLFLPDQQGPAEPVSIGAVLILFAAMHGLDSLATNYVAKKGLYPS